MKGLWQDVKPVTAKLIEQRYPELDTTRNGECAATITNFGKGKITAVYGPVGTLYAATHSAANRKFIQRVVDRLYTPMVEVKGPPTIEVVLRKKDNKVILHLLNTTAMQVAENYATTDFIPAVGPVEIAVTLKKKPSRVMLEPESKKLKGVWKKGKWLATIDNLHIHSMIVFE